MSNDTKKRPQGRPRSAETQRLIDGINGMLPRDEKTEAILLRCQAITGPGAIAKRKELLATLEDGAGERRAEAHAHQNAERAKYGKRARDYVDLFLEPYNANFQNADWAVLTTLVSLLLVFEDAASRYTPEPDSLDIAEAARGYWPLRAPKSWASTHCFLQAYRAGLGAQQGLYWDRHDMYPSRVGYPDPHESEDGRVRCEQRKIAIGIDDDGKLVEIGIREKRQLQAASYVASTSAGAWLGFMTMMPPDDWDQARTLPDPNWKPEWGHPACILPERGQGAAGLFRNSVFPLLFPADRERGFAAVKQVWSHRMRKQRILDEPSFAFDEAIKVLGAVVGICPQSEAAARNLFRYCLCREKAGRLAPRWALRLCRSEHCNTPLFVHEVPESRGNASPPNYCRAHALDGEFERQRRRRRKLKRAR